MEKKLIEAVRGRTILYDTSHADYLNVKLKMLIWEEIAQEIGIKFGSEAKTVWRKLRHALRDALRRQKKSGAAETTSKPWRFQTEMGFLQPYMTNRKREKNLLHENYIGLIKRNQDELECENNPEEEPESEEREDENGITGNTSKIHIQETPLDRPGLSRENTPTLRKKIKINEKSAKIPPTLLQQSIENLENRAAEGAGLLKRVQPSSNSLYHFFMSMYETTKILPPSSQHVVKNQIFKAVTDMEANILGYSQTHTFQPSQFNSYHVQHQYDRYCSSRHSASTPISSYSDNQSHQIEATIQNVPEVKEEMELLDDFVSHFPEN